MAMSLVGLARSFLSDCTGYFFTPAWRTEAEAEAERIDDARQQAAGAADAAEALLPRRALGADPAGLGKAIGAADAHAAKARQAVADAGTARTRIATLLTDNNAGNDPLGDNDDAVDACQAAATRAQVAVTSLRAAQAPNRAWQAMRDRLQALAPRLQAATAAKGAGATQSAADRHAYLQSVLDDAARAPWSAEAVQRAATEVEKALPGLSDSVRAAEGRQGGAVLDLDALRATCMQTFVRTAAGYELETVKASVLAKLREKDPAIGARHLVKLTAPLEAEQDRLAAALRAAADPVAFDAALQASLTAYREGVEDFAQSAESDAVLGQAKTMADAAIGKERDSAAFEKKRAEVQDALMELRVSGAPAYTYLKKTFDDIVAAAYRNRDWTRATDRTLPNLLKELDTAYAKYKSVALPQIQAQQNDVDALRKQLETMAKTARAPGAQAVIARVRATLDDADAFLECDGNLEAAEPAAAMIAAARTLLADFGQSAGAFARLADDVAAIRTMLEDDALSVVPDPVLAGLRERADALEATDSDLSIQAFTSAVAALRTDVTAQTKFAEQLTQWRADAQTALGTLDAKYTLYAKAIAAAKPAAFPGGKRPDPELGTVRQDVQALHDMVGVEVRAEGFSAQQDAWNDTIGRAGRLLDTLYDPAAKRLIDPGASVADSAEGAARKELIVQVTQRWKDATAKAKSQRKTIADAGGNMDEFGVLQAQLAALQSTLATDPDVAVAQLDDIEARLTRLPGTPDHAAAVARAIAQVPTQWKGVLNQVTGRMGALHDAIEAAAATSPYAANIATLAKLFDGALKGLSPAAFDAIAAQLTDSRPEARKTRRAAREAGLRLVREYQDRLFGDPLFLHIQKNPFGIGVFGELFRFLDRLELEFLRAAA